MNFEHKEKCFPQFEKLVVQKKQSGWIDGEWQRYVMWIGEWNDFTRDKTKEVSLQNVFFHYINLYSTNVEKVQKI